MTHPPQNLSRDYKAGWYDALNGESRRIVVVGYEPGEVVGPFADRDQAYEWIMREHATNGLNDFDILEMRAPGGAA